MTYLLAAILMTIMIVVTFKYFEIYEIPTFPAIVVNYGVCLFCGILIGGYNPTMGEIVQASWFPWAVLISILFIGGFYIIAVAVQKVGLAASSVANKVAMVIPVLVAFTFYDDVATAGKILGILGAVASVFLISHKAGGNLAEVKKNIYLPIVVFFLGGTIETILNYVQKTHLGENEIALFLSSAFGSAFLIGLVVLMARRKKLTGKILLAGLILGVPNYFSLHFLLQALELSGLESSQIFPLNSMGVVALSAMAGLLLFKERLSGLNWLGLAVAMGSILAISFG